MVCAALGDVDEAFAWLEKAYAEREVTLSLFPSFERSALTATTLIVLPIPLRRDPRYQALLRKIGKK